MKNIASVIVLYHPSEEVATLIASSALNVGSVIVVVNAAEEKLLEKIALVEKVTILRNSSNVGLAIALNMGISYAFEKVDADFVALFDQDSLPTAGLIEALVYEFESSGLLNLACIGPRLIDVKGDGIISRKKNPQIDISKVCSIPTSGSVISKTAFYDIGPMLDRLFIDGIDHEWCFRAYSKGYVVKVSDHQDMIHDMGDIGINYCGQYKPIHRSPIRHYYIIRNTLYLVRLTYVPIRWKLVELLKTVRRIMAYLVFSSDRLASARLICLGIFDGLCGRLGAFSNLHLNSVDK